MKFDVYYLLDPEGPDAAARRAEITDVFCKQFSPAWQLRFLSNVDQRECFRIALEKDSHLVVVEDGVIFLPRIEEYLRRCIDNVSGVAWDLVYTDIAFIDPDEVYRIFPPEAEMVRLNNLQIHYLTNVGFIGGGCYVVNKWSKNKVWTQLNEVDTVDLAVETALRRLIRRGDIKGCTLFPFGTKQLTAFAERRTYLADPPIEKKVIPPRDFDIL